MHYGAIHYYVTLFSALFTPPFPSVTKVSLHGYYVTNGNVKNKAIDNKVYEHIMDE